MAENKAHSYASTHGEPPGKRTVLHTALNLARAEPNTAHYGQLIKGSKQVYCKACQAGFRYAPKRVRLALGEISGNIRPPRAPRTIYV